jgi:cupin fold WbuC family metalloprotein
MRDADPPGATRIDRALLDALSERARSSGRRRMHHNIHRHDEQPAHRLLNAMEPDSYVRPHRHLDPTKDETILCLRGQFGCVLFDDAGAVTSRCVLDPLEMPGIDIGHGRYHSLVALQEGSVMFEVKAGPYVPTGAGEFAPWAPADGEAADDYLAWMHQLFSRAAEPQAAWHTGCGR